MQAIVVTAFLLFVTSSTAPVKEGKNLNDVEYFSDSGGEYHL